MSAGEIARSLEAQDAKFSDDFMEQFHNDFLTQVQFITLFFVISLSLFIYFVIPFLAINCLNITTNKQSMIYKDKKDIKDSE